MSAATVHRSAASPLLIDRIVLGVGLGLVAWSRRRTANRVRHAVVPAGLRSLSYAERAGRMRDTYDATSFRSGAVPPERIR
jgi:hypothetical protein